MPRVFVSYVRENSKEVTQLVDALKAHEVAVWLDKTHLKPGNRWANVIRREIAQGDFFIACFSTEYSKRTKTYMNEEITQAAEQLRQRTRDKPWFIPVLLSDCEIPDINIGAGETLRSFHWVTLYGGWDDGVRRILSVVQPEPGGEVIDHHQQNIYAEEDILGLIPYSLTNALNDQKLERESEKFSLVQDNHRIHEYSRKEVDKLTPTQREKLFTADPEMTAWWRGKSIQSNAWPLFRVQGGIWISKDQIKKVPVEQHGAFWKIPGLLEWYGQDLVF
jgi:hypothetical protein